MLDDLAHVFAALQQLRLSLPPNTPIWLGGPGHLPAPQLPSCVTCMTQAADLDQHLELLRARTR
jgi:hypothetical protein